MPQPRTHCVRWGPRSPSPKRGRSGPCLLWPNGWMNQDGTWHGGRPQPRRLCVRCGPRPPPEKGGGAPSPIFGPFLLRTNGWCIKMPLGMVVGLSPGDFVFDGDPAPPPQKVGEAPPQFPTKSITAKRLHGSRCHLVQK